jgi:hypothetical protein
LRQFNRAFAAVPARLRQRLTNSDALSPDESERFGWHSSALLLNGADCHVYRGNLAQSRMHAARGTLLRPHGSPPNFSRYAALDITLNGALRAFREVDTTWGALNVANTVFPRPAWQ